MVVGGRLAIWWDTTAADTMDDRVNWLRRLTATGVSNDRVAQLFDQSVALRTALHVNDRQHLGVEVMQRLGGCHLVDIGLTARVALVAGSVPPRGGVGFGCGGDEEFWRWRGR